MQLLLHTAAAAVRVNHQPSLDLKVTFVCEVRVEVQDWGYNLHLGRCIHYRSPLVSRVSRSPAYNAENISGPSEKAFL